MLVYYYIVFVDYYFALSQWALTPLESLYNSL